MRAYYPNERGVIQRAQSIIASPRPKQEALLFEYYAQCSSALRDLEALNKPDDPQIIKFIATLNLRLGKHQIAGEYWSRLAEIDPKQESMALERAVEAFSRCGDTISAARALASLQRLSNYSVETLSSLASRVKRLEVPELCFRAGKVLEEGKVSETLDLLRKVAGNLDWPIHNIVLMEDLIKSILHESRFHCDTDSNDIETQQGSPLHSEKRFQPLFVSGMLYSGSGALSAFLKDQNLHFPFGMMEISLWQRQGQELRSISSEGFSLPFVRLSIITCMIEIIFGLSLTRRLKGQAAEHLIRRSLLYHCRTESQYEELRVALRLFCDNFQKAMQSNCHSQEGAIMLFRMFNKYILNALGRPGTVSVLNNVFKVDDKYALQLAKGGKLVVVVRDPRDQLADILVNRRKMSCTDPRFANLELQFINEQKRRMKCLNALLCNPRWRGMVECISFEEFVCSPRLRTMLLDKLGLDTRLCPHKSFLPSDSRKNVGIYTNVLPVEISSRIHEALSPYVVAPTLSP